MICEDRTRCRSGRYSPEETRTSSSNGESLLSCVEDDEFGISVPLPKLDMNKEVGAEPLQASP